MLDLDKIVINGAFYELFESAFGDDFFEIIASLRSTPRITALRKKKEEELTAEQKEELFTENLRMASIMKKQSARIAYVGSKLYKKEYRCSYDDFIAWLAGTEAADFQKPEVIQGLWAKVTADQQSPKSVKNA